MPDGDTGRGRVVKDPRNRKYFHFDEVEGFILDRLNGENTALDIQVEMAAWLGEEFALEEVHDFLDTLRDKGLLDGGIALPAHDPVVGRKVIDALNQGGFVLRKAEDEPPPGLAVARRPKGEALKFDEAIEALQAGRFQAALRMFEEILAANPSNQRAAAIKQVLLQAGEVAALAEEEKNAKVEKKTNPLYYQIGLFNPDRFFSAVEPFARWIWTKPFMVFYCALLVVAAYIALSHRSRLFTELPPVSSGMWIAAFMGTAILLTALHECAHGLTCKHFGGKIPETGFLLIFFFMPALFVDVSDAWLFRRRRDRMLVGLAGPLFDIGAASAALVVWNILPPGFGKVLAFTALTISAGSAVLNLNPLLRLDGYYIMSDLSGIPNLRATAFSALTSRLAPRRDTSTTDKLSPRARRFVLFYALFSGAYVASVLFLIGSFAMSYSTTILGLWGPLLVSLFIVWLMRRMLMVVTLGVGRRVRNMSSRKWILAGALTVAMAMLSMVPWSLRVSGSASLRADERRGVRPSVEGNLAEILVKEGDFVRKGQVVARLDRTALNLQLAMVEAEIVREQANLDLLRSGPELEQIRQGKEQIAAARVELEVDRKTLARLTRLHEEGLASAHSAELAQRDVLVGEGKVRAALDSLKLLERGVRPERIAAAAAEVARLQTRAADIRQKLELTDLVAKNDGVVVSEGLQDRLGEAIPVGGLVMEIADTRHLRAEIHVAESEIGDVAPGQVVNLRLAAFPDRRFTGVVEEIAPVAVPGEFGTISFRVRCNVEDPDGLLRPGMTGSAKIEAGRYPLARLIARRALRLVDPSLF